MGRSVDGVSATTKAWGEANRVVDAHMANAIQQNDAMHAARTSLTESLEAHIATTTAEANTWAAAGNACDAAFATAEESIQARVDSVAAATADHGRLFDAANAEAEEMRGQANQHVDAVGDFSEAMAEARKATEAFRDEMAALCDEVASKHTAFAALNAETHGSIQQAVADGMAPRAAVRAEVDTIRSSMEETITANGANYAKQVAAQQEALEAAMATQKAATEAMQTADAEVRTAAVASVSSAKGSIDNLCTDIVDKQLQTFDASVASHNGSTDALVRGFAVSHARAVNEVVVATGSTETVPIDEADISAIEAMAAPAVTAASSEDDATSSEDVENAAPAPVTASKEAPVATKKPVADNNAARTRARTRSRSTSRSSIPKRALRPRAASGAKKL